MEISNIQVVFSSPRNLFFMFSLPFIVILHYVMLRYTRGRVLQFANFVAMARIAAPRFQQTNLLQLLARLLTLTFIILAVSGMAANYVTQGLESDYILAIDTSSSMSSTDMLPTRIDAAKESANEFVSFVPEATAIGVVAFSGTAFVKQRLTDDKNNVLAAIDGLEISPVGGTDIGEAIVSSVNLLITTERPKTVILLTDGRSNVGVGVTRAITYANEQGVQVFTIGMGTIEGGSPQGINVTLTLDEETLKAIAEQTNAKYIFTSDKAQLIDAYKSIVISGEKKITLNLTPLLLIFVLLFSFADWVLINTWYKRIP